MSIDMSREVDEVDKSGGGGGRGGTDGLCLCHSLATFRRKASFFFFMIGLLTLFTRMGCTHEYWKKYN
jgi:hypothetical protein